MSEDNASGGPSPASIPAVRRHQIVEAAAQLFEGRDPTEVPFEEIADAAGVSRALVYNYFGDRSGLLAAVYLHLFEAMDVAPRATNVDRDAPGRGALPRRSSRPTSASSPSDPGAWRLLRAGEPDRAPALASRGPPRRASPASPRAGAASAEALDRRRRRRRACSRRPCSSSLESTRALARPRRDRRVLVGLIWRGVSSLDGPGRHRQLRTLNWRRLLGPSPIATAGSVD